MKLSLQQKTNLLGVTLVAAFMLLSTLKEVYVGHVEQSLSPFPLIFICFTFASVFFVLLYKIRGYSSLLKNIKTAWRDVLMLNLTTMLSWIGPFYALQYIEPSIENSINTAIGPIFTILVNSVARKQHKALLTEWLASFSIFILLIYLVTISLLGRSSVGHLTPMHLIIGVLGCVIGGISIAGNTIFSKRLSEQGMKTEFVMATRFYTLALVSGLIALFTVNQLQLFEAHFAGIVLLATVGIALPLFFLQKGIERCEPVTVAFIIVLGPVFTYLVEFMDPRLHLAWQTFLGVLLICVCVFTSIIARHRSYKNG